MYGNESDPQRVELKERFIEQRGYWHEAWERLLAADVNYFEAYLNFSSIPAKNNALDAKTRELIYLALDASATHLFPSGTRAHMQNAIRYGATREEILGVFQCLSVVGIHTMSMGLPILLEELGLNDETDPRKRPAAVDGE